MIGGCDEAGVGCLHRSAGGGVLFGISETEADGDSGIDLIHGGIVEVPHFLPQAAFIEGTDLFEEDHGILCKSHTVGKHIDVGREMCFAHAGSNGSGDNGRAVAIADIVLYDEDGAQTSLLGSDNGAEVGIINVSASDGIHGFHPFFWRDTNILVNLRAV